jgi:hypothetical protein
MDPVGLTYYALVCGGLAVLLDRIPGRVTRLCVGLAVGAISASILPFIRTVL